jgi:hypothetical protein
LDRTDDLRLRGGIFQSNTSEGVGSSLLTWDAASIWSDPAGYGSIVWMTIRMTMAHPIKEARPFR